MSKEKISLSKAAGILNTRNISNISTDIKNKNIVIVKPSRLTKDNQDKVIIKIGH